MVALTSSLSGLDGVYNWTLRRIDGQPQEESSLTKKALLWLTFTKTPLQIKELQCTLATLYDTEGFDPQSVPPIKIILTACHSLVTTVAAKMLMQVLRARCKTCTQQQPTNTHNNTLTLWGVMGIIHVCEYGRGSWL
jgi:hypothetical protein